MRLLEPKIIRFVAILGIITISGCTTPPSVAPIAHAPIPISTSNPIEIKPVTPATAAIMAQNCFACHGPKGVSSSVIPSLHHLTANYIAAQLKAFQSSERASTVMGRHAKGYSDAEIEALATYIAGLKK